MTCKYRCGNACSHPAPNTSGNAYFGDVLSDLMSRRGLLRAGSLGAVVATAAVAAPAAIAAVKDTASPTPSGRGGLGFTPVPPDTGDRVVVPEGYDQAVVVRWGEPILPGAPEFDFDHQTAEAQAGQFGYNCDYLALIPLGKNRALLWSNHEYTDEQLMFRGYEGGGRPLPLQTYAVWRSS